MSKVGDVIEFEGVRYKAILPLGQYLSSNSCSLCKGCVFENSVGCIVIDELSCREEESGIDFIWVRYDKGTASS